jgi:hypothetical protein
MDSTIIYSLAYAGFFAFFIVLVTFDLPRFSPYFDCFSEDFGFVEVGSPRISLFSCLVVPVFADDSRLKMP